jgi:hypothetical protein
MRKRISSAHVLAIIAILLALGGNALAFHLGKNSVGTRQLKKEAVTAPKVKKGTLTGTQINLSTLGTVPSAADAHTAANAQTLDGQTADQLASASKLHCPPGTVPAGGVCFDPNNRPKAVWIKALNECASAGGMLPSIAELATWVITQPEKTEPLWTDSLFTEGGTYTPTVYGSNIGVAYTYLESEFSAEYRCVTAPTK